MVESSKIILCCTSCSFSCNTYGKCEVSLELHFRKVEVAQVGMDGRLTEYHTNFKHPGASLGMVEMINAGHSGCLRADLLGL